ncbi:RDD family protein [Sulfidibacter corallicola]|uniref:Uncharacterized protein n=1 Tax=Sulfidibacter corallicola TaxID=2818388 RepID=A0A8A4TFQ9_SULCO|nr:hypothetical protein [Sulfidibacter corallicola]QTD47538.1 hypothetical protein J3U87_18240 [Sulfidibacter corallicola]
MKVCYVCGAALAPDEPQCGQCRTTRETLAALRSARATPRFLFGSAKAASLPSRVEADTPSRPVVEDKPKKAAPKPKPAVVFSADGDSEPDLDLIVERDSPLDMVAEPEPAREPLLVRGSAHVADVAMVLLFNAWVLFMILWLSHRDFSDLVTFSLLPILFVMLSFTFLYFWLFLGLFKKTLGTMLVEYLRDRKSEPPLAS